MNDDQIMFLVLLMIMGGFGTGVMYLIAYIVGG